MFILNDRIDSFPYSRGRSTLHSNRLHDFFVIIPRCYKDVYISFCPRTTSPWKYLLGECFPVTYEINDLNKVDRGYHPTPFLFYPSLFGIPLTYSVHPSSFSQTT